MSVAVGTHVVCVCVCVHACVRACVRACLNIKFNLYNLTDHYCKYAVVAVFLQGGRVDIR